MDAAIIKSRPEQLTIRPPSEWRSLLLRSTRGCNWNRCKFCGVYGALGQPDFSIRKVDDVKRDIDWYRQYTDGLDTAFIGDADPLCRPAEDSMTIIEYLKKQIPHISRVTAYARAATLYRLKSEGLQRLAASGLSRVHMGLESGDLTTLKFHCKGQSPKSVIEATRWTKDAGIEVSFYVLLGLGGSDRWKEHIDGTATVINASNPEFIRLRRIWLFGTESSKTEAENPLWSEIRAGRFLQQTPEGTVLELRRLITALNGIKSHLVCDHANNYLPIEGDFPHDKDRMLTEIDEFLAMPQKDREQHYRDVGSRI